MTCLVCKSALHFSRTFLSFHARIGEEPGARRGEDGSHAEFSSAGFAGRDLGGRLGLASRGTKERIMRPLQAAVQRLRPQRCLVLCLNTLTFQTQSPCQRK